MQATANWYHSAILRIFNKEISWMNDTIRVMLVTDSYTPDKTTHQFKSQVIGEATGTGYTAGGVALTTKTATIDNVTGVFTLDAADSVWVNATLSNVKYAVIYDDSHSSDALLGYIELDQAVSPLNQNIAIEWHTDGVFSVTLGGGSI
ncbi:hypothetical protein ABFB50_00655 [Dehalococcoides sp. THU3]|uniref:hypothetical protein n=1 Tax=Dehalococcoides TaxID=61434 RepID=UPI0032189F3D